VTDPVNAVRVPLPVVVGEVVGDELGDGDGDGDGVAVGWAVGFGVALGDADACGVALGCALADGDADGVVAAMTAAPLTISASTATGGAILRMSGTSIEGSGRPARRPRQPAGDAMSAPWAVDAPRVGHGLRNLHHPLIRRSSIARHHGRKILRCRGGSDDESVGDARPA